MDREHKTFTRRDAMCATIKAAAFFAVAPVLPALVGCGEGSTTTTSTSNPSLAPQPVPAGVLTSSTVSVLASTAGTMPDRFLGLSYEKGDFAKEGLFNGSNTALAAMFQLLGNGVLRIGGNSVDKTLWTATGAGMTTGQVAPADVDALAAFLKLTSWKVLYGVNLGTSTPALAAAEVAYVQAKLGTALVGIEIGNEPDLYGDAGSYFVGNWSLSAFENRWDMFRSAILAQTPAAVLTGPASASNASTWTAPFAQYATGQKISLLTQHYYRANGQLATSTAAYLVTPDTKLPNTAQPVQAAALAIGVPWRMAETNSYYNGGASGASDTFASALWVIDYMFNLALDGCSGLNLHGGNDGPYTPIQNSGATVIGAKPEFYGLLLLALAGQGTLQQTTVSAGSLNVTAYAIQKADGSLSLVLINKDSTQNLQLAATLNKTYTTASLVQLLGSSLTATTDQTLGGSTVGADGSFTASSTYAPASFSGTTLDCYVPALSAVLVRLS